MNLLGEAVRHKVFGEGRIVSVTGNYVTVRFGQEEKTFLFPDAFENFLTLENGELSERMQAYLRKRQQKKRLIQETDSNEQKPDVADIPEREEIQRHPRRKKSRIRLNIAFKCNYCDGGKSDKIIGFRGICSDEMIRYNIEVERHVWCSLPECPCREYYDGKLTRAELDEYFNGDGVCYESVMLRDWKAVAGIIHHGKNEGKPMRILQVQPNSLAVLTTREPGMNEEDRFIFAVFLVDDTYEGDNAEAGYVEADIEYRMEMAPSEAIQLKFWNYYRNPNAPGLVRFGSGLHRYLSDIQAAQILRDMSAVKKGTKDEAMADKFFRHFCRINRIDTDSIPEPSGALIINRKKNA